MGCLKMTRYLVYAILLLGTAVLGDHHDKFEGHQLYRVAGTGEQFSTLEAELDLLSMTPASRSTSGKLEALLRLSPEEKERWLSYFDAESMAYTKIADNLASILRDEEAQIKQKRSGNRDGEMSWDTYYSHQEINDYIDQLPEKYPGLVTVVNAGLSYEGRQIKYVRISTTRFEDLRKPVIFLDAMVHAREWVTTPVAMYIIDRLVNSVYEQLTDSIDWVIVPLANPDGYEFSREENRMWRKTRSRSHANSDACPGVDGNRNFDHEWGTRPQSANPCSDIYEGPSVFSEPEIRVIRNAVLANVQRTALYISIHSHGSMFLYAWGNNGTLPANGLGLHLAGIRMGTAIDEQADQSLGGVRNYIVGNAAQVLYYTSGTSRDWTKAIGIPYTYTLELPGYTYAFLVPPTYVEQIVRETWAGIAEGARYVLYIW